jgi:hypothetical protein
MRKSHHRTLVSILTQHNRLANSTIVNAWQLDDLTLVLAELFDERPVLSDLVEGQVEVVDHVSLGAAALVSEETAEGLRLQLRLVLVEVAADGTELLGHGGSTLILDVDLGIVGVQDQIRDPREVLLVADVQVGDRDI